MLSLSEENYLKAIYILNQRELGGANTNAIADRLSAKASSVTAMLKKLREKDLVIYEKYKAANLSEEGQKAAINVVRKHRLWEYFLYEKLKFNWSEVHELAEQLEHIQSTELTDRLDDFLGNPKRDPHGDPIPNKDGVLPPKLEDTLADLEEKQRATILGVQDHGEAFFNYLKSLEIKLGDKCELMKRNDYDDSIELKLMADKRIINLSNAVAKNLLIKVG